MTFSRDVSDVSPALDGLMNIQHIRMVNTIATNHDKRSDEAIIAKTELANSAASVLENTTGLAPIMATAGVIALVFHYITDRKATETAMAPSPPALLKRLDLAKRGDLISISVQAHNVEVVTTAGASLLLLRLSDAMR